MKRLIAPPLSAASRPSNKTTIFSPLSLTVRLQRQHALHVVGFGDLGPIGVIAGLEGAADRVRIVTQGASDAGGRVRQERARQA